MLGRKLLHYRVVEAIGQGGMSVVYRGRDEHLGRDVAIKVLHPFLAEKPECRTRLAREARAVARLEHDNIVKVFDFSGEPPTLDEKPGAVRTEHDGFIVAELVKGPTLKRWGDKHSVWRVPEVGALIVWQLLHALQHAHDNGIVHRDLKPENVMVRDDGVLKLMDFGIAQIADQSGLTITGTLLGSPAHMAPETIEGHQADERSDLFSMGTVLYWLTTGSLPFEALSPHALLKQIVDGKAAPAQQKSARVSDDLARVIAKSLQTNPADRFRTATEFAAALGEVIERAGLSVDSESLRRLLEAPADTLPKASNTVRAAFLERAGRHLDEGQTSRALSCLNRVLADHPDDVDARALLDRLHDDSDSDDTADTVVPAEIRIDAAGAATLNAAVVDANRLESTRLSPARRVRWQSLLVGVSAVVMVGLAVVVARAVDDVADARTAAATDAGVALVADVGIDDGTSTEVEPLRTESRPTLPVVAGARLARPLADRGLPRVQVTRVTEKLNLIGGEVSPPAPQATRLGDKTAKPVFSSRLKVADTVPVTFRVKPWADVEVDGMVIARNTLSFDAKLVPGPHVVVFRNPRAKEHEVRFTVPEAGPQPVITAQLEPRPALLVVRSNVDDAFVDVGGQVGKPASDTVARPLVVALDESKATREVFVYKRGYSAYRKRHVFLAGETLNLNVVLEPDTVEPVVPTPSP
jgi:serine/threonine protein kinase